MRWTVTLLTLALFAPTTAQEYSRPTEVGRKALGEMVRRRVAAGGLKEEKGPKTGAAVLVVADLAKFRGGDGRGRTGYRMIWGCSGIAPEIEDSSSCCRVGSRLEVPR